jgi:hypothetical protein
VITGTGWTKKYPNIEYADYYRTGSLKKIKENPVLANTNIAPWISEVPALSVYDWRGCRMLDTHWCLALPSCDLKACTSLSQLCDATTV